MEFLDKGILAVSVAVEINGKEEYIIENVVKLLEENIEYLIKVKNKFHYLGYFEDE